MRKKKTFAVILTMIMTAIPYGQVQAELLADSLALEEVVVTGTRNATDVRHLPMTVTVIGRDLLTAEHQTSVLPIVMREVTYCSRYGTLQHKSRKSRHFRWEIVVAGTLSSDACYGEDEVAPLRLGRDASAFAQEEARFRLDGAQRAWKCCAVLPRYSTEATPWVA